MNWPAEKIYPDDCAFLLAIPTDREGFAKDLHDPAKDFLQAHFRDSALSDEAKWRTYEPTAEDLNSLLRFLGRKKVRVMANATVADWQRTQEVAKVVILFAHWRSGTIRDAEVQWSKINLLELGSKTENGILGRVRQILKEARGDQATLVTKLNQMLLEGQLGPHPWFGKGLNQRAASPEHRLFINRKFLDEALPGVFGRNTSVEFSDGLISIETIASCALPSFTGVIDLSVCNSILLGELIKCYAPRCLTVSTRLPARVDFRIIFYRALFDLLAQGRPYVSTLEDLRRRLARLLDGTV